MQRVKCNNLESDDTFYIKFKEGISVLDLIKEISAYNKNDKGYIKILFNDENGSLLQLDANIYYSHGIARMPVCEKPKDFEKIIKFIENNKVNRAFCIVQFNEANYWIRINPTESMGLPVRKACFPMQTLSIIGSDT